ncbi:MAG: hypothetical protein K2X87_30735, partial [Gemmataceae bacterium]|nr:hypothetical protein [Gemmataceae bacterium]
MRESTVLKEFMEEGRALGLEVGRAEGQADSLLTVLEGRFGLVPADLAAAVRGTTDAARLRNWVGLAVGAADLASFRA